MRGCLSASVFRGCGWWSTTTPPAPPSASGTHGAAAGATDAVVVTLGTGIGGGLINEQRVGRRWRLGYAGEIGQWAWWWTRRGRAYPCGKRGCWERFASGSGLGRLAREAAHAGRLDEVLGRAGGDPEAVRAEDVTAAAATGDAGAQGSWRNSGGGWRSVWPTWPTSSIRRSSSWAAAWSTRWTW